MAFISSLQSDPASMTRLHVFSFAMKTALRSAFLIIVLCLLVAPYASWSDEKPKADRATLEAEFKKAEGELAATKENTKERADAAKKTMQLASDIAWTAFDAGKFDEAATWFATSAKLNDESHLHARRY